MPIGEENELTEEQMAQQTKMEELKAKMHGQSDEFIRDIFSQVVQPVITTRVLPEIEKICTDLLGGLTPKSKVTVTKFRQTMKAINELILMKLFSPVGQAA